MSQIVIEPTRGWRLLDWRELVEYRDLFYFLVLRDIKVLYKQTVLGFTWAIINPVVNMVIFSIVFGTMAGVPSDGVPYPIFSFAALVPWTYFSGSLTGSVQSLVSNTNLITKVYFPRLVLPFTPVLAKLVDFTIALVILFLMMAFYGIVPDWRVATLPILVGVMVLTAAGAGMWLSALTVQYRDIKHAMTFLVQVLMYAAPVVWPVSLVTERFGEAATVLYALYPMVGVIEGFRSAVVGSNPMPWGLLAVGTASALTLWVSGTFYFRRLERCFADVA